MKTLRHNQGMARLVLLGLAAMVMTALMGLSVTYGQETPTPTPTATPTETPTETPTPTVTATPTPDLVRYLPVGSGYGAIVLTVTGGEALNAVLLVVLLAISLMTLMVRLSRD